MAVGKVNYQVQEVVCLVVSMDNDAFVYEIIAVSIEPEVYILSFYDLLRLDRTRVFACDGKAIADHVHHVGR